jgi:hypothetical protein
VLRTTIIKGECEENVRHHIKAVWQKFEALLSVVCDRKMSAKVKDNVHRTIMRPAMIYGAEAWTMQIKEE